MYFARTRILAIKFYLRALGAVFGRARNAHFVFSAIYSDKHGVKGNNVRNNLCLKVLRTLLSLFTLLCSKKYGLQIEGK